MYNDLALIPWNDVQHAFNACTQMGLDHLNGASLKALVGLSQGTFHHDASRFVMSFVQPGSHTYELGKCIVSYLSNPGA